MKKTIIVTSLIAAFNTPAYAEDTRSKAETKGFGIGAVVGAVLGGVPGLIIGAAGGALAAREAEAGKEIDAKEKELATVQSKAELNEQQLIEAEAKLKTLERKIVEQGSMNPASLTQRAAKTEGLRYASAIENGFALTVQFKTDSSDLEPRYLKQLEELAHAVSTIPSVQINLEGHTDHTGTKTHNKKLSEKRIAAVEALLNKSGIDKGRVQSIAYGKQYAVTDSQDKEARFFDRRVVITFKINKNVIASN